MEVFFCDRCSCRITEGELEDHLAVRCGELHFCKRCWQDPEVREAVAKVTGKLPVVQEETPAPVAPASGPRKIPARSRPPTPGSLKPHRNGARRTPPALAALAVGSRRGAGATVAVIGGVLGALAGFLSVTVLSGRPSAASGPRQSWVRETGPGEQRTSFVGKFSLDKVLSGVTIMLPSGGRWTVHVNGRPAYSGPARANSRIQVGPEWLVQGWNEVRALLEDPSERVRGGTETPRIERS